MCANRSFSQGRSACQGWWRPVRVDLVDLARPGVFEANGAVEAVVFSTVRLRTLNRSIITFVRADVGVVRPAEL